MLMVRVSESSSDRRHATGRPRGLTRSSDGFGTAGGGTEGTQELEAQFLIDFPLILLRVSSHVSSARRVLGVTHEGNMGAFLTREQASACVPRAQAFNLNPDVV